jgi:hypothetical protein
MAALLGSCLDCCHGCSLGCSPRSQVPSRKKASPGLDGEGLTKEPSGSPSRRGFETPRSSSSGSSRSLLLGAPFCGASASRKACRRAGRKGFIPASVLLRVEEERRQPSSWEKCVDDPLPPRHGSTPQNASRSWAALRIVFSSRAGVFFRWSRVEHLPLLPSQNLLFRHFFNFAM